MLGTLLSKNKYYLRPTYFKYIKHTLSTSRDHKFHPGNILHVYLIAGEPSGDVIGANLIRSLKKLSKNEIQISGVGGERMIEAGLCKSVISIDKIAVMGTVEVVSKLYNLNKNVNKVVDHIINAKPDVIVAIDAKGFNKAVIKRYFKKEYGESDRQVLLDTFDDEFHHVLLPPPPTVQYVAPSYWAYKSFAKDTPKQLLKYFQKIYCILPFENKLLNEYNIPNLYVGHTAIEEMIRLFHRSSSTSSSSSSSSSVVLGSNSSGNSNKHNNFLSNLRKNIELCRSMARSRFHIQENDNDNKVREKVLLLFPGSRLQEVDKSLPLIYSTLKNLFVEKEEIENKWTIIIPTLSVHSPVGRKVSTFVHDIKSDIENKKSFFHVKNIMYINNDDLDMKRDAFAAADAAIAMSGTVVTELALANVQTLVIYPGSFITSVLAKKLAKVNFVSIPNILTNKSLIDELLFDDCTVENFTTMAKNILFSNNCSDEEIVKRNKVLDDGLLTLLNQDITIKQDSNNNVYCDDRNAIKCLPSEIAATDLLELGKQHQQNVKKLFKCFN
jgi:lipid-A-disaccharide synthase